MTDPSHDEAPEPVVSSWAFELLRGVGVFVAAALLLGVVALLFAVVALGSNVPDLSDLRELALPLLAAGTLAGLVWGLAEGLAVRGRLRAGVALLALGGTVAPLGARFALSLLEKGSSLEAVDAVLTLLTNETEHVLVETAGGLATALALGGTLLVARGWGVSRRGQSLALVFGGVTWLAGLLDWPAEVHGRHPFELVDSTLAVAFPRAGALGGLRADLLDQTALILLLLVVLALALPWLLHAIGRAVRRLVESSGADEAEAARPTFVWRQARRRTAIGLALLLVVELALVPSVTLVRHVRDALELSRLQARANAGDPAALVELGRQQLGLEGHEAEGLAALRRAAYMGDPDAMTSLVYYLGYGKNPDPPRVVEALAWAKQLRATNKGSSYLVFQVARQNPRLPESRPFLLEEIAEIWSSVPAGRAPDQSTLRPIARIHDTMGDRAAADSFLREWAATESPDALLVLGERLEDGSRSSVEWAEAARCYERAAVFQGTSGARAAWRRGLLEERGALGPADDVAAATWYRLAVALDGKDWRTRRSLDKLLARRPDLK